MSRSLLLSYGRVAQFAESACLTSRKLLVRVQPRLCWLRRFPIAEWRSGTARVKDARVQGRVLRGRAAIQQPSLLVVEAQPVERPPETRGVAGSIPADHMRHGSVAQGRAPGSYPGKRWLEPSRGHHLEGLPWAWYPVSKTGGSSGLGGSTPSPSASGGMAELERQRVASAQAAHVVRRFESCCLRHRPVAQRSRAVGFEPTCARSIRAGASMLLRRLPMLLRRLPIA